MTQVWSYRSFSAKRDKHMTQVWQTLFFANLGVPYYENTVSHTSTAVPVSNKALLFLVHGM